MENQSASDTSHRNYVPEEDDELDVSPDSNSRGSNDLNLTGSVEFREGGGFFRNIKNNVTIEPPMFLFMFGMASTGTIVQNLYIDRICRVTLGYNETFCQKYVDHPLDATDNKTLIHELDSQTTQYNLARSLIETIIPIIYSMFLGSWTDIHGSKFPMLVSMFCYTCSALVYMMFSLMPSVPPQFLLISSVPVSLGGGLVAVVLAAFSYITYVTSIENRSFRIGVMEASWYAGAPLGLIIGSQIYKWGGFVPVFIVSGVFQFMAFLYCLFFVRNNVSDCGVPTSTNCCPYIDLFNIDYVKDTFATVFSAREGPRRKLILMLIATVCIRIMTLFGPNNCMYLFIRLQLGWDQQTFAYFTMYEGILGILGGVIMLASLKILNLKDAITGLFSCAGIVVTNIIVAFLPHNNHGYNYAWILYLAVTFQMFAGMTSIIVRSMLSKIVPKHEIGKIFTFVACAETAVPIAAGFMYTYIFNSTENSLPGAFSLLSAAMNSIIILNFIYFFFSSRRHPEVYKVLEEEENVIGIN